MSNGTCAQGCGRPIKARGLCATHYAWARRHGKFAVRPKMTTEERFWSKVNKTESCWLWTGPDNGNGYGNIVIERRMKLAHRLAYEWLVGPIPKGMDLDHLCRVRACVNPDHLEPVSHRVNLLRSPVNFAAVNARKTHCIHGHEYIDDNTYVDRRGYRH